MSEDYLAQQPTAIWNSVSGVWEKPGTANLFCAHSELFSEAWPTSGMMRNGQVYELPTPVRLTTDSEFSSSPTLPTVMANGPMRNSSTAFRNHQSGPMLNQAMELLRGELPKEYDSWEQVPIEYLPVPQESLLRSPKASEGQGGALGEAEALRRGNSVGVRDQIMDLVAGQGLKVSRALDNELLGTPRATAANSSAVQVETGAPKGRIEDQVKMLPTLRASDGYERRNRKTMERIANEGGDMTMVTLAATTTDWGKFEPAIRRWEQVLGRPAPAPTKPDGKDGAHRLSSLFTEWMMGLPEGWIIGHGLSRNDELKMAGNGVVPQQAELALRILLDDVELSRTVKKIND